VGFVRPKTSSVRKWKLIGQAQARFLGGETRFHVLDWSFIISFLSFPIYVSFHQGSLAYYMRSFGIKFTAITESQTRYYFSLNVLELPMHFKYSKFYKKKWLISSQIMHKGRHSRHFWKMAVMMRRRDWRNSKFKSPYHRKGSLQGPTSHHPDKLSWQVPRVQILVRKRRSPRPLSSALALKMWGRNGLGLLGSHRRILK